MNLLIDTHAFLWFVTGDRRLSAKAKHAMETADVQWFVSIVSVWEMAIKTSLGRLIFPSSFDEYIAAKLDAGFHLLPIEWRHAAAVAKLPFHHRDPFDRMIIVQGTVENMPIVSGDPVFRSYEVDIIW